MLGKPQNLGTIESAGRTCTPPTQPHPTHSPASQKERKCRNTTQGAYCGHVLGKQQNLGIISSAGRTCTPHTQPHNHTPPTAQPARKRERRRNTTQGAYCGHVPGKPPTLVFSKVRVGPGPPPTQSPSHPPPTVQPAQPSRKRERRRNTTQCAYCGLVPGKPPTLVSSKVLVGPGSHTHTQIQAASSPCSQSRAL